MPDTEDSRAQMTPDEFRQLRDLVYDHCGILFRDEMKFVMERRLWPRLEALGLVDFSAYHRWLRFGLHRKAELEGAIEALTTKETYFAREPLQLRSFSEEVLPVLFARNRPQRRLRIWSAGCSTGEEPYTLSMLIHDAGLFAEWDVEVYGSDISKRALAAARSAEYRPTSMRAAPPDFVARHFEDAPGGLKRVKPEVRSWVSFGHLNLLDAEMAQLVPKMDAIFCRNVMIYFDLPARRRVLEVFYDKLVEGGYLLLGHSESLITHNAAFELVHLKNDLVYRRPEARPAR